MGRARDVLAPWRATGAGLCGSRLGRWGWLGAARIWHSRRCARRAEVWGCTDDRLLQCASFVPVWRIRLACWGLFWGGDDARLRTGRPDLGMSKPEAGCGALWERFEDAAAVVVCGSAMTCTCRMVVVLGCCLTEEGGSIRGWMQGAGPDMVSAGPSSRRKAGGPAQWWCARRMGDMRGPVEVRVDLGLLHVSGCTG